MTLVGYRGKLAGDLAQVVLLTEESTIDLLSDITLLQQIQDLYDYYIWQIIIKMVEDTYPSWYKDDPRFSLKQIQVMALELLDMIIVYKLDEKTYRVIYCINAVTGHKNSDNFYGGHYMTIHIDLDSDYNWNKRYGFGMH